MLLLAKIKKLDVADIDQVMLIEQENYKYPWPKAFFMNDLASPQSICLSGWIDQRLTCYGLAMVAGVELHITNIAVHKNYQRHGLASQIVAEIEKEGCNRGCSYAYLEVRVSNSVAIELYKKIGYGVVYTRRQYYLDGEDAYVMEKLL